MPDRLPHGPAIAVVLGVLYATSAFAQKPFYKGKIIRNIVATAARGGYRHDSSALLSSGTRRAMNSARLLLPDTRV
jgi:hypothetical protein